MEGVAARIGPSPSDENQKLREELARQDVEIANLRAGLEQAQNMLVRFQKLVSDADVVWQCPRLGMPEKLAWFGLAAAGVRIESSTVCWQMGAIGAIYGASERSGMRALEGTKQETRGSLVGEGVVGVVDRARNVLRLELRDVPTALRARIARGSDGRQKVIFETDGLDDALFEQSESHSAQGEIVRANDSAVVAPQLPSPSDQDAGTFGATNGVKSAALLARNININISPETSGYINIEPQTAPHVDRSSQARATFDTKSAESGPAAGTVAETLARLIDRLDDAPARQARAVELTMEIAAILSAAARQAADRKKIQFKDDFWDRDEFLSNLTAAICVDGDFPPERLWPILNSLKRGSTRKGGPIDKPGAWFRNAIRVQASEVVGERMDRQGVGNAIKELTRRPK